MATVTIGIPVYNEAKFIAETLLSAVNQSYKDIQIIVSDNASTDNTLAIVNEIAANYANIKVIHHTSNLGAIKNFVFAMQQANTEFFCWLGGHDVMHPLFIEKALAAYQQQAGISLVYPESQVIDEKGEKQAIFPNSSIDTSHLSLTFGALKVLKNLGPCTAIHGLHRTKQVQSYQIKEIVGTDSMILYHAAIQGKLLSLKENLYFRREVRKENAAQTLQRYNQYGLKNKSLANPYKEMIREHWDYTLKAKMGFVRKSVLLCVGIPLLAARVAYYNWFKKK